MCVCVSMIHGKMDQSMDLEMWSLSHINNIKQAPCCPWCWMCQHVHVSRGKMDQSVDMESMYYCGPCYCMKKLYAVLVVECTRILSEQYIQCAVCIATEMFCEGCSPAHVLA